MSNMNTNNNLVKPHGGVLYDLYLTDTDKILDYQSKVLSMQSHTLTRHQLCDLELILNGAFSPLKGFICHSDYESVLRNMRLSNGALWPIPITLDVTTSFAKKLGIGEEIVLCDQERVPLAILKISDIWEADKIFQALEVFGTIDETHSGVNYLLNHTNDIYI